MTNLIPIFITNFNVIMILSSKFDKSVILLPIINANISAGHLSWVSVPVGLLLLTVVKSIH